jgi:hypothetical protein
MRGARAARATGAAAGMGAAGGVTHCAAANAAVARETEIKMNGREFMSFYPLTYLKCLPAASGVRFFFLLSADVGAQHPYLEQNAFGLELLA